MSIPKLVWWGTGAPDLMKAEIPQGHLHASPGGWTFYSADGSTMRTFVTPSGQIQDSIAAAERFAHELTPKDAPVKHDSRKSRVDLLDPSFLVSVGDVFRYGANKYAVRNYLKPPGLKMSQVYGAAMRHLLAFWSGEVFDPESGLPHLSHAACNLQMLHELMVSNLPDVDDRPKKP